MSDIAAEQGKTELDALLDIACADGLLTGLALLGDEPSRADWEAKRMLWSDDRVVIGASDAGAHLESIGSFAIPTMFIDHAVRRHALTTLEEAIRLLTDVPARLYGLRDRGRLEVGWSADVVVFDEGTIGSEPLRTRFDLPGGSQRLYAGGTGIEHVLVNGVSVVEHGAMTDEHPGRLIRAGVDTVDPSLV